MMLLFLMLIGILFLDHATADPRFKRQERSCTTPDRFPGNCLSIRNCQPLLPLLRKANQDKEAADFLRKSKCGGYAEVCCPIAEKKESADLMVENCGKSKATEHNRVVGGSPAEPGAWPWIAALGYRGLASREVDWRCGGSLINKRYVLTAAHCIRIPPNLFLTLSVVRLGEHDISSNNDGATPIDLGIEKTIVHEDYRSQSNDIALIRLDSDVSFTDKISPICLPQLSNVRNANHENKFPFIAGWGETNLDGPTSDVLLETQVPVVDNESCRAAYARQGATITDKQICAGKGGKDSCRGDSGGPLMLPLTGVYYQIGIVSYGYKCAEPGYPGVYSRVSSYLDWIKNKME